MCPEADRLWFAVHHVIVSGHVGTDLSCRCPCFVIGVFPDCSHLFPIQT